MKIIKYYHYINGDIFMEEILWKLFKRTGDIKYYLLIKKFGSVSDESNKSRRNSSRRTKL